MSTRPEHWFAAAVALLLLSPGAARAQGNVAANGPGLAAVTRQLRRGCPRPRGGPPGAASFVPPAWLLRGESRAPARRSQALLVRELQALDALVPQTGPTDPRRPELLFRHAAVLQELVDDARARGAAAELTAYARRAAASLDAINAGHPRWARLDEALFLAAVAHTDAGAMPDARQRYLLLIQRFPQSRYVPAAYARFGEYFYGQGDVASARQFFDRVAMYPGATLLYGVALYRLAWAARAGGDERGAQSYFARVVDFAQSTPAVLDAPELEPAARREFCSP